jgi:membrane protein DedA with SNARE-associated domain
MSAVTDLLSTATDLLSSAWALPALALLAALDGLVPVVPSETVLVSLAAGPDRWDGLAVAMLVVAAAAGAFAGDQVAYAVGQRLAARRSLRPGGRAARLLEQGRRAVQKHGGPLLLVCRFVPGGRAATTITAGILGYPRRAFAAWTATGALAWAGCYCVAGVAASAWLPGNVLLAVPVGVVGTALVATAIDRTSRAVAARTRRAAGEMADEALEPNSPTA